MKWGLLIGLCLIPITGRAAYQTTFNACTGCSDYVGVSTGSLAPGATNYIQNTSVLQSGSTFYTSSGTVNSSLNLPYLTASQCVQTNASNQLVSSGGSCGASSNLTSTQTWTGLNTWTTPGVSSYTFGVYVGSITAAFNYQIGGTEFLTDQGASGLSNAVRSTFVGATGRTSATQCSQATCVGNSACTALTSGGDVTAVGYQAGNALTSGATLEDTCLGSQSCLRATTSNKNACVGYQSCLNLTTSAGGNDVGVGALALLTATTGGNDTCIGFNCLDLLTTANNDVGVGQGSGGDITTGSQNTCIGANSPGGFGQACSEIKTGSGNTFVGAGANIAITGNVNNTNNTGIGLNATIGSVSAEIDNSSCLGANCSVTSSNTMILGGGPGTNAESVNIMGNTLNTYSLFVGTASAYNAATTIAISTNAEIVVAGSTGTSGQFLSSQGPGSPVKWASSGSTLLSGTQTWTGQNNWTGPLPSSFTFGVNVGTFSGAGLSTCGDTTHAVGFTSTNTFSCISVTGSGASSLAVTTGTSAGWTGPVVSSPTAVINFDSTTFASSLTGTATNFIMVSATGSINVGSMTVNGAGASGTTNILFVGSGSNKFVFTAGGQAGIDKNPTASTQLDVSGLVNSDTGFQALTSNFMGGYFEQATKLKPAFVMNSNGANFGFVENDNTGVWDLGFGNSQTTLGTAVLKWDSSPAVNVISSMTVSGAKGLTVSFGATASTLTVASAAGATYEATFSTSAFYHVQISTNGHFLTGGSTPTVSSCGSTPNGSVVGNDHFGVITVGGGTVTACTLTFANTYGTGCIVACTISDSITTTTPDVTTTPTTMTLGFSASIGGGTVMYHCAGVTVGCQ